MIVCGHFADGAEKFSASVLEDETKPEWYLRQMLGTANFRAGRVLAFMSGNLCYQIEHHLYPDLPSNRYAEIAQRVQAVCVKYDLPYTTGPLAYQCEPIRAPPAPPASRGARTGAHTTGVAWDPATTGSAASPRSAAGR